MDRIEELTFCLLDGTLTAAEEAELAQLCGHDAQAIERHLEILELEAALRGLGKAPDVAGRTLAEIRRVGADDLERAVMRTIAQLPEPAWAPGRARRWIPVAVAASLALAVAIGLWSGGREAPSPVAPKLAVITERVELLSAAGQPLTAAPHTNIQAGQTLVAHEDDHALLIYPDETRIELFGPSKLLVVDDASGRKRLELLAGSMHLDVRPQPADRPLIVSTPQGEVRVLGTRFRLAAGGDRTRIEMEEGKVAFNRRSDGRTIEVPQGAYVVAEESPEDVAVQPLPPTLEAPLWSQAKAGSALSVSPSGAQLAAGLRNGGALIFDIETGELQAELPAAAASDPSPGALSRLAFAPEDPWLVGIAERGHVLRWNTVSHECQLVASWGHTVALKILAHDGRLLGRTLGGGWQPKVRIWQLPVVGEPQWVRDVDGKNDIWAAAFSHDGRRLAIGTRIGWVHLQDVDSGEEHWRHRAGTQNIRQLALSPDERWLALYSPEVGIQLWSLENDSLVASWLPEGPAARSLAFSPESDRLAAGLADRTVRFWSVPDGRPTLLIETGKRGAEQISFTPDGKRLATAGQDTAVWELP
jgi:hypothetical protein